MTTIVLRANTPTGLTNAQIDANFTNLNNDKVETSYLANTFPGTANITTLGTITTGTWNATTIAVNRGGTGTTTSTGTGSVVLSSSPTLVTPVLGVASATSINKVAITAPATGSTLTIADGKTLTASNTLTFTGTDASSVAFGAGGTVAYVANKLSAFAATTSAELAGVISDETGTGKLVFGTSPTFTTSILTDSTSFAIANTTATTLQIGGAATNISIGAATGVTTVNNTLTVAGNLVVNGTTTTINSTSIAVDDIAIELGVVATPTDITANGGGIILKGSTDKTFLWNSSDVAWNSSDSINVASGKGFEVAGTQVLSATTLGSGVVNSSLTSVGTIATGTWNATTIATNKGGTGLTSFTANGAVYATSTSALTTGTLPTASGGTGLTSFTANGAVYATSTSALTTGTLPVASGGTGVTTSTGTGSVVLSASPTLSGTTTVATINATTLQLGGTSITSTAAEINLLDGSVSAAVVNGKAVVYGSAGEVIAAVGTAALPSFAFSGDTNTGLYNTADKVYVSCGGAASVYFGTAEQYNYGNLYISTADDLNADATTTYRDSGGLYLRSKYWNGTASANTDWNLLNDATAATATGNQLLFRVGSTTKLTLTNAGALTAVDNITAYSDIRHKTDIEKIQNPLEKVMALNGYTYTRKETGARQTGVIAQEVQEILPEAVMIAENEEKTLSVAYGNMVGLLIEAIKAQQEQINDLKNQIANLK